MLQEREIQSRGQSHSVNSRTLKQWVILCLSHSQTSAPGKCSQIACEFWPQSCRRRDVKCWCKRALFSHPREEHSMDWCRCRPELSERFGSQLVCMNFTGKPYGPIPWCLVFRGKLSRPAALIICQKFLPRLVLTHGWLFPAPIIQLPWLCVVLLREDRKGICRCGHGGDKHHTGSNTSRDLLTIWLKAPDSLNRANLGCMLTGVITKRGCCMRLCKIVVSLRVFALFCARLCVVSCQNGL